MIDALEMYRGRKIVVAMSGGVDSAMAAVALRQAGAEVIGVHMRVWDYSDCADDLNGKIATCCSPADADDVTIGKIVSITVEADIAVEFVMDFPPDQVLLKIERVGGVNSEYGFRFHGAVYFENPDCIGIGYFLNATVSESRSRFFDSALRMGFPVGQDTIDDHRLYIPSDDPPTFVTTVSQLGDGCNTSEFGTNRPDAIRAILLEPNLHAALLRPYSVVLY